LSALQQFLNLDMNLSEYKHRDDLAESLNNSALGQQFKYSAYKGRQFFNLGESIDEVAEIKQKLEWLKWELYHLVLFAQMPSTDDNMQFALK